MSVTGQLKSLVEARIASGVPRVRICALSGVSEPVMSRFLSNRCELSASNIDKLCEYFQVHLVEKQQYPIGLST